MGVIAADTIPTTISHFFCVFIANTDVHAKSGQHWCAFNISENGKVEFFDSYGKPPIFYNNLFARWLIEHSQSFEYNSKRLQSDTSNVCGLYCLHVLRQRLIGQPMKSIVDYFSTVNYYVNDYFIFQYMSLIFSKCTQTKYVYNQTCMALIKFTSYFSYVFLLLPLYTLVKVKTNRYYQTLIFLR